MARAARGRNNGVTLFKRTLHTNMRQSGRGINKGGVKTTTNLLGRLVSGREREASRGFKDNGVKVRRGRR